MREYKKDLLTKYILIDNYSDYVYGLLRKEDTLDELYSTGEFDKMLRKHSNTEIKCKLKDCLDISRTGKLAQLHPLLLNILDRFNDNKERKETYMEIQYNKLAEKINNAIAKISPSNVYKVKNINLANNCIRVSVENHWRYFEIHFYSRENRVRDCTIEIPSSVITLYHDTDNADQLTEFCEKENKAIIQVISGVTYLYNNKYILEDICQALDNYEMEKVRIEDIYEYNNDIIATDGTAILEAAARQAYLDGKLNV
ncbi:MAG: hypothetical protein II453_18495 [Alphaproteobacteria bacterium]|nr:hypothetical protein [Alphaproteobacteria bacterium]